MTDTVLDTRDLSMRFGGVQAVNNVNFSLKERELRCLIGPNGAGKSTFFKCLTGQIRLNHTHGRVFIRGHDVTGWRAYEIVRLGVGIKTQVPSVMNGLTVWENLWLAAQAQGIGVHVMSTFATDPVATHVKHVLGIPETLNIAFAIALGYSTAAPDALRVRREVERFAHRNRYRG